MPVRRGDAAPRVPRPGRGSRTEPSPRSARNWEPAVLTLSEGTGRRQGNHRYGASTKRGTRMFPSLRRREPVLGRPRRIDS